MSAGRASTLLLAAAGDVGAQRTFANQAYEQFLVAGEDFKEIAAAKYLIFARRAALQGTNSDSEVLVFVLALLGEWQADRGNKDICRRLNAAGLNLADALADKVHEAMADMVANCGGMDPATLVEARRQREAGAR